MRTRKKWAVPVVVTCSYCKKSITRTKKWYTQASKLSNKFYCDKICNAQGKTTKFNTPCVVCGLIVQRNFSKKNISGFYFCSHSCRATHFNKDKWKKSNGPDWRPTWGYRKYLESECAGCGDTRTFLLQIHHIDGNRSNSDITNMETVCPSCHVTRHLHQDKAGNWGLNLHKLTPRDLLDKFKPGSLMVKTDPFGGSFESSNLSPASIEL